MPESEFLTVSEVAGRLRVDEETVRRWLRTRQLPGTRLGRGGMGWRIKITDLEKFIADRSQ